MMRCTCCGRWTVETILIQQSLSAPARPYLRVRDGAHWMGDYAYPHEVQAVLERAGVFDKMADEPQR